MEVSMAQKGQYLGLWLYDDAARLFLNLPRKASKQQASRWLVLGLVEDEAPVGLWISVDKIEERTPDGQRVSKKWAVTPPICLVRWEFVIHAQLFGKSDDTQVIGFRAER
jgi:hypothetical protein